MSARCWMACAIQRVRVGIPSRPCGTWVEVVCGPKIVLVASLVCGRIVSLLVFLLNSFCGVNIGLQGVFVISRVSSLIGHVFDNLSSVLCERVLWRTIHNIPCLPPSLAAALHTYLPYLLSLSLTHTHPLSLPPLSPSLSHSCRQYRIALFFFWLEQNQRSDIWWNTYGLV